MQCGETLGQLGKRTEISKLFGRQRRRVDSEARQVPRKHGGHFFCNVEGDRHLRLQRRRADVRRSDEIRKLEQRVVARRLGREHIGRGRGQPARLQGLAQSRLVDDSATRGVDEARRRFHQRQLRPTDQVAIRIDEWHVHGNEVGTLEEVIEADQRDVEKLRPLHRNHGVVGDDVHLEAVRTLRHLGAHVAETDHPECLAADLGADKLRAIPLPALDRRICLRHPARKREQQRHRVLGGSHDVAARRVDHQDALARGSLDVDVVDADAGAADDTELATRLDDRRGDPCLAAHDERVEVRNSPDQLRLFELADYGDLARAAQSLEAVLGQRVGDEDLGHWGRAA